MSKCSYCQTDNTKQLNCAACLQVSYCNKKCQKDHWKLHKPRCQPWKIVSVEGKGKGVIATRKIKKGDVVMMEKPVLVLDKGGNNYNPEDLSFTEQFMKQPKKIREEILDLHHERPEESNFLLKLFDIFNCNNIGIDVGIGSSSGQAVYLNISRLNHSCSPNVVWSYKRSNMIMKEVRALRDIDVGEELSATYLGNNVFATSSERRIQLQKSWKFECKCRLCNLPDDEQEENDKKRMMMNKLHWRTPTLKMSGRFEEAFESEWTKLALMMEMEEDLIMEIPNALIEVYELSELGRRKGLALRDYSHYAKEAKEMAEKFGDCFLEVVEEKIDSARRGGRSFDMESLMEQFLNNF